MLVYALQQMNREDVAAILLDKHRQNVELTPECFDSIHSRVDTTTIATSTTSVKVVIDTPETILEENEQALIENELR